LKARRLIHEKTLLEFKKFLVRIDEEVPKNLDVHLILDNYVTQKTPDIQRWLLQRRRFCLPLHAHLGIVVEHGGALVR
jgi:hypothetical protein